MCLDPFMYAPAYTETADGPCDHGRPCSQRTRYDWDELGQLLRARRWDLTLTPGTLADDPSLVAGDPAWDLRYA